MVVCKVLKTYLKQSTKKKSNKITVLVTTGQSDEACCALSYPYKLSTQSRMLQVSV